jgi:hypothetical protein
MNSGPDFLLVAEQSWHGAIVYTSPINSQDDFFIAEREKNVRNIIMKLIPSSTTRSGRCKIYYFCRS